MLKAKVTRRLTQLKNKCVFGARRNCRREMVEWPWWCTERMSHVQQRQQPMSALLVFCTHVMDYSDVHADHVDLTSPDLTCFSRELTGSDRCAQPLPFVNPCVRCVQCAQASGVKGTSMVVCIYYIVCLCVCFSLSLCVCVCVQPKFSDACVVSFFDRATRY